MGKLNVGNLEGNFPNYRITLHEDSEMAVDSQLIIQNQQYMPMPANTTGAFAAATQSFRQGQVRWNTTINDLEVFTGTAWVSRTSVGNTSSPLGSADNPFVSMAQADDEEVTNGLYYVQAGSYTQQVYIGVFGSERWMLIASNNARSSVIPSGNNRRSTNYYVNRTGAGGTPLGTADPDDDYIIGAMIDSFNFTQIKVYGWGRGTTNNSTSWGGTRGTTVEATWNTTTLTSITPRANVTIVGNLHPSASYFVGDGIRKDNEVGGFNANTNQTTIGGVGVANANGDPANGCYLGHGSNEGNYEGWYDSGGNANSQGYTTWVR